ncbi:MAG: DUF418 domain-containing protein [Gemmobacter sp.]
MFAAAFLWSRAFGQGPLERLLRAVTRWDMSDRRG